VKRRQMLGAASAGLAAALWPSWLRDAFADPPPACEAPGGALPPALARAAALAGALRRAREAARPLLVLVIPADDMAKYGRGRSFGELLNFGSDVQLAPLARADVVCATMADLKKLVPNAGAGEPLMVLVSTERVPATARQLDADLTADAGRMRGDSWEASDKIDDAASDRRIAQMAALLRDALGADDAHAATLAAEVKKRLKDKPPAGTRWANSSGCGITIEGDDDNMAMGCGMGHVPRKSRRFLYFFTKRVL